MSTGDGERRLRASVGKAVFGEPESKERLDASLAPLEGGQFLQHRQVTVSGKVAAAVQTVLADVKFIYPFLMKVAPNKTDGDLLTPAVSFGLEFKTTPNVIIQPQVIKWVENESQWYTGAKLAVLVFAPGAESLASFSAIIHATFFGYAAPSEDDSET